MRRPTQDASENVPGEIARLRLHLDELAAQPDAALLDRYALQRPQRPPGIYWQLRWLAGRALRWLQSAGILFAEPWPVSLKHGNHARNAKPLVIWAVGADRETLREASGRFAALLDDLPGYAPVLVTDVADFAHFSRLGWLVEYLPVIDGDGEPFESRKTRHLARLYRGSPALPVSVGLVPEMTAQMIRGWISQELQAGP